MKLIQLSDIHLTTPGNTIGGRDPRRNFERALTHVLRDRSCGVAFVGDDCVTVHMVESGYDGPIHVESSPDYQARDRETMVR